MEKFKRIIITGDIHGDIFNLLTRLKKYDLTSNDLVILLGDAGLDYYSFYNDKNFDMDEKHTREFLKQKVSASILCVQGNHEVPFNEMKNVTIVEKFGAKLLVKDGIYFIPNGSELLINNKSFLVVGGAYSVDKEYRNKFHLPHWENEEINTMEESKIFVNARGKHYDYVLTHTCPYSVMPKEAFFEWVDQSKIKNKTENFLDCLKNNITFGQWFCGHWHINKQVDNFTFLFQDCVELKFNERNNMEENLK